MCGLQVPPISVYPLNIIILKNALKNLDKYELSETCIKDINIFKKELNANLFTTKNIFGIQTQRPNNYFQDFGKKQSNNSNFYFSSSKVSENFAYNISLQAFKDDLRFDESYFPIILIIMLLQLEEFLGGGHLPIIQA